MTEPTQQAVTAWMESMEFELVKVDDGYNWFKGDPHKDYIGCTQAQAAFFYQAQMEAVAKSEDQLVNRLYVALQEQHAMNMNVYGANHTAPPTIEDARNQLYPSNQKGTE